MARRRTSGCPAGIEQTPKLPPMKAWEVEAILARVRFVLDRRTDYRMWCRGEWCVPVPRHTRDLKTGTLRSIIREAGMTVEEFLSHRR
jgi:predicted RNA binding protein YcfA (HicA-like mRNA interferase family)